MPTTPIDQILRFILALDIWKIVKAGFLLGIFLYLIFAVVIIRQVNLMSDALEIELEGLIRTVAWIHLFLVIGVLMFGIIYL